MNSHCCWLYSTMSSIKSYSYPIKSPSTSLSKPSKYVKYPTSNPITYRKFHQISHGKIPIFPSPHNEIWKIPNKYPIKKLPSPTKKTKKTKAPSYASCAASGVNWRIRSSRQLVPLYLWCGGFYAVRRTSERGWMTGWPTNNFVGGNRIIWEIHRLVIPTENWEKTWETWEDDGNDQHESGRYSWLINVNQCE